MVFNTLLRFLGVLWIAISSFKTAGESCRAMLMWRCTHKGGIGPVSPIPKHSKQQKCPVQRSQGREVLGLAA